MIAVHLGPGRLGLGLVVDVLLECGFEVCLVGAPGKDERKQYLLAFTDPRRGLLVREVAWSSNAGRADELPPEVATRLTEEEPVLVTSSLGDAAPEREAFISELLGRRPPGAETILLACENEPDPAYERLREKHVEVHYCPCVVDRICNWGKPDVDEERRRRLVVHPVAQWVVAHPEPEGSKPLQLLDRAPEVLVVKERLEAYKARKLWAVNGVHLVLALMARETGVDELPLTGLRADAFQEAAGPLISTILTTVEHKWPELPADPDFAADRVRAFSESPDSASRILRERLVRRDLRPLMERLQSRLGSAASAACALELNCGPFDQVVELVLDTLRKRAAYLPEGHPPELPSAATDAEVVAMFHGFASSWMAKEEAEHVAVRLDHMLASQRDE